MTEIILTMNNTPYCLYSDKPGIARFSYICTVCHREFYTDNYLTVGQICHHCRPVKPLGMFKTEFMVLDEDNDDPV